MKGKKRITITVDKELLDWLDIQISHKRFANRSHALEFLANRKKELEDEAKNYRYLA